MVRKIAFGLLWLGFVVYAFFLAPPDKPGTLELIKNLSIGQWQGVNPLVIALFNLMGIWPLIYSAVVFIDGRGQKIPAWLFVTASFGVGAFALLPYLALREPNNQFLGQKNILLKLLDSRVTGFVLTVGTVILVAYGLREGDWRSFVQEWQTNRFIHVMSIDFCLLSLLFPTLLGDDMARRGWKNPQFFWLIALTPLFGPLVYLSVRPSLPEVGIESISKQPATN
ncbi:MULTISPECIES: DUF2834 domain-containing protein [unclassified Nostoc]|uniref:DUF2834 domain-containing protein n=1 Tax=unclassified Nostoc TaxID=2593658 RepID=UPI0025AB35B9|nr:MULTISPECIES: DUF2834 domain-containing protein [unclassified Nostoc]MDM9582509.1 DUF2834 domain-containing protein [Nostoc sp. GT001]MDZ7944697.1 DUF2834 domain-containing protein [Nostoc sp. EfeVER01]MDZ7993744.1 DUF2834 domain-containing protein [Nostoc sp. EspVER01]